MKILGIDPGFERLGIAVLEKNKNDKMLVDKPIKLFALFMFVAIPLPGTGVWSGSLVAGALKLKPTHAFFAIALANFFSSVLIFLATFGFFV